MLSHKEGVNLKTRGDSVGKEGNGFINQEEKFSGSKSHLIWRMRSIKERTPTEGEEETEIKLPSDTSLGSSSYVLFHGVIVVRMVECWGVIQST